MHAPVLLQDRSSLDWPDAAYSPTVGIGGHHARVVHRLEGASLLDDLVARGDAVWAVELRCPKTLLARIEVSPEATQIVRWNRGEIDGAAWLLPGLLAPAPLRLPASADLHTVWRSALPEVPAGWWLARGDAYRIEPLVESLLRFELDENLAAGRMAVESNQGSGNLRFTVRSAPDVHRQAIQGDRSLWGAALIGVCALFTREFPAGEDQQEGGSSSLADELRYRLEEASVPTWEDEERYDPTAAATVIEPFVFPVEPEAEPHE